MLHSSTESRSAIDSAELIRVTLDIAREPATSAIPPLGDESALGLDDTSLTQDPSPHPLPPEQTSNRYEGTSGDDTENGTSLNDTFNMAQGGNDTVFGNAGNDTIKFGSTFNSGDVVRGGTGSDTLELSGGAYAGGLTITKNMLQGVEKIELTSDNSYDFTIMFGVINVSQLTIDGGSIGATHELRVDASATSHSILVFGSAGDDHLTGGAGDDRLESGSGGIDTMTGNDGNDEFDFIGNALTAACRIYGGSGFDEIDIAGDYSSPVTLSGQTISSIEQLGVSPFTNLDLTLADGNVSAGKTLTVDASSVQDGDSVVLDGSAETDAHFDVVTGRGTETFRGGQLSDFFELQNGGTDTIIYGGDGDDEFQMSQEFGTHDELRGGNGYDALILTANAAVNHLTISGAMMRDVEAIEVHDTSFNIKTRDNVVMAGGTLVVDATLLPSTASLHFDGSAETDGGFILDGGSGADALVGGAHGDAITGGALGDVLTGGESNDLFFYNGPSESTSVRFDTITDFNANADGFFIPGGVSGIDAKINMGALSQASFDDDLSNAIGPNELHIHHAVLFKPDSGDYAGINLLIVEGNGTAGYQAGFDYVIELPNGAHLANLSTDNFFG